MHHFKAMVTDTTLARTRANSKPLYNDEELKDWISQAEYLKKHQLKSLPPRKKEWRRKKDEDIAKHQRIWLGVNLESDGQRRSSLDSQIESKELIYDRSDVFGSCSSNQGLGTPDGDRSKLPLIDEKEEYRNLKFEAKSDSSLDAPNDPVIAVVPHQISKEIPENTNTYEVDEVVNNWHPSRLFSTSKRGQSGKDLKWFLGSLKADQRL
ncbi:hypothetical protein BGZ46_005755 [Entomortierella lignicola]|nr:hypothetical protein BGZ46_005755 [Entomortierella lignicola]